MSFPLVFSPKVDGQTVTAAELNQLALQNSQALDKTGGDTATGPCIFDDLTISNTLGKVLKYGDESITRGYIDFTTTADSATGLPDFIYPTASPTQPLWTQRTAYVSSSVSGLIGKIRIPHNAELESLVLMFEAAGGHVGLPAIQPSIVLVQKQIFGLPLPPIATASNPAASLGAYQAGPILILMSGLTEIITTQSKEYFLIFRPEAGANAIPGLDVYGAAWTAKITEQDKG